MSIYQKRILFLCAARSIRSLMATSLLTAQARELWDSWHTPARVSLEEYELVRRVLDEVGVALLSTSQEAEPSFGLTWDEGIILCSGLSNT